MTDFTGYSDGMNKAIPVGTEAISNGDDRIREFKEDIAYRLNIEHVFAYSGNTCDAAATGEHRIVTFTVQTTDPTVADNKYILYTKDSTVSGGTICELFGRDENDNICQLTNGGKPYLGDDLVYAEEVQLTNTGNSLYGDLIVCTANGRFALPTGEEASFDTTEGNMFYETDGDKLKFRSATAWLTVLTTLTQAVTNCVQASGDAAGSCDIGFEPDFIIAWTDNSSHQIWMWSALDAAKNKSFADGDVISSSLKISVSSTTVTVANLSGKYRFLAFELSATAKSIA